MGWRDPQLVAWVSHFLICGIHFYLKYLVKSQEQPKNPGLTPAQHIATQLAKRLEAFKTAVAEDHED